MIISLKKDDFIFGTSPLGIAIGIPDVLFDVSLIRSNRVINRWGCLVKSDSIITEISLEMVWDDVGIIIPFDPEEDRDKIIKICEAKRILISSLSCEGLDSIIENGGKNKISDMKKVFVAEVNVNQVLEWFEWQDSGMPLAMWKEKNPRFEI